MVERFYLKLGYFKAGVTIAESDEDNPKGIHTELLRYCPPLEPIDTLQPQTQ